MLYKKICLDCNKTIYCHHECHIINVTVTPSIYCCCFNCVKEGFSIPIQRFEHCKTRYRYAFRLLEDTQMNCPLIREEDKLQLKSFIALWKLC